MFDKDVSINFNWIVNSSKLPTFKDSLQEEGAIIEDDTQEYEPPGVSKSEPMLILVGIIALGSLVRIIIKAIKDIKYGGLIINMTKDPPVIKEEKALDRGTVVVVFPDGKVSYNESNYNDIPEHIFTLLKKMGKVIK
ncbi:MAG: hypothetical protein ACFE9S_16470 [Candidatus Hermodarchaeota archaeon]